MHKKYLFLMTLIVGIAALSVYIILRAAQLPNKENNGFSRTSMGVLEKLEAKNLGDYVTKISGITNEYIYVSGDDPSWVLRMDYKLNTVDTFRYGVSLNHALRSPGIIVDSPNIYMYANEISYFIFGNLDSLKVDTVKLNTELITRTAQISSKRLAVRSIDSTQSKQHFKILDCQTGNVLIEKSVVDEQQFGGFDTDGSFAFDKSSNLLVYVPMFQNSIYCLDTNLNIVYKSRTIDTTFVNMVKIGLVDEGGVTKVMATAPRMIVNKFIEIRDNNLFIVSGLRSDNENLSFFNQHIVIDVYHFLDGKYKYTYYIPKLNNKNPKEFKVLGNKIFMIYEGGGFGIYKINE